MDTIKVGVVGTGFIGPAHIEALRRIPGIEVAAIGASSREKAERQADTLGIGNAYGDFTELLENPDIQAVHICTPNDLHFPMARDALKAGKHVVCEKPLATTAGEAGQLVELAEKSGLVNAVHFNIRFYPLMAHIRDMIASGELGEIYSIHGSYLQDWLFYPTDYNWRLEPERSGQSRAIADIGSHWMDLVEFISGLSISEVMADFATFHKTRKKPLKPVDTYAGKMLKPSDYRDVPITTEDYATVLLGFDNGARGVLTVSQVFAGRKNRLYFEIAGSKKSLAWESEIPNQVWIGSRDKANEILLRDPSLVTPKSASLIDYPGGHNEGFPDTLKQLCKSVYKAVRLGKPPEDADYPTFEAGLRELVLCEKILESSKKRTWISNNSREEYKMITLGFVSAVVADLGFEETIDLAADYGFDCVEILCWPPGKAERRYAGVTHIDVTDLSDKTCGSIQDYLKKKGVYISGLGYYPNYLDPDRTQGDFFVRHFKKVITAAAKLGIPVANTFIGRDYTKNIEDNFSLFLEDLARYRILCRRQEG